MFANSMSLVDDCGLTFLHVFPFSARPGTPAARMKQLNGEVIAARAAALREKGVAALNAHLASAQGTQHPSADGERRPRPLGGFHAGEDRGAGAGNIVDAVVNGHDGSALLAVVQS